MDLSKLTPEQRAEVEEKLKNMSPEELAQLQEQQCIFCQIIEGKVPSKKVFEDDVCLAILDINPAAKGHILLMPKTHISIMPQLDEKTGSHMLQVARELSRSLLKNMRVSGSTIFVANGLAAGQRAQHFMLHVIPRKDGDDLFGYEKHLVDLEKRKALRELIASRMAQLTDWEDIYSEKSEEDSQEEPEDEQIELDDVPDHVLSAAQDAIEGFILDEAEKELMNGEIVFDLEGEAGGVRYELKIDSDGKVLKIEHDDDKDEDNESDESEELEHSEKEEDSEETEETDESTDSSLDDIANLFK